jgi:hypothetical protein
VKARKVLNAQLLRASKRTAAQKSSNLRAPRTLTSLGKLDWGQELVCDDETIDPDDAESAGLTQCTKVPSRQEDRLLMAENSEVKGATFVTTGRSKHPLSGVMPVTNSTQLRGVCASNDCDFTFEFLQKIAGEPWNLERFKAHIDNCHSPPVHADDSTDVFADGDSARSSPRRFRRTSYDADELARIVVDSHTDTALTKLTPAAVKLLLGAYTIAKPSNDLARRVCDKAIEMLRGIPADNFKVRFAFSQLELK